MKVLNTNNSIKTKPAYKRVSNVHLKGMVLVTWPWPPVVSSLLSNTLIGYPQYSQSLIPRLVHWLLMHVYWCFCVANDCDDVFVCRWRWPPLGSATHVIGWLCAGDPPQQLLWNQLRRCDAKTLTQQHIIDFIWVLTLGFFYTQVFGSSSLYLAFDCMHNIL